MSAKEESKPAVAADAPIVSHGRGGTTSPIPPPLRFATLRSKTDEEKKDKETSAPIQRPTLTVKSYAQGQWVTRAMVLILLVYILSPPPSKEN